MSDATDIGYDVIPRPLNSPKKISLAFDRVVGRA